MTSDTEELQAWRVRRPTRFRALRAYTLTARILLGYLWLRSWRPIIGQASYEARLVALHRRNSLRLVRAILDLGGLFIKVGQLISILTNFLPAEFRGELEQLQDSIPARPLEEVRARIRKELGEAPETLFSHFDPLPLASASLAQVHRATMTDGRDVAVKVQHADIEEISALDLEILGRVLLMIQFVARIRGLESYHEDISRLIHQELDFKREAANIATIRANFTENSAVRFPVVVPELSSQRVLTTHFVDAVKVTDTARLSEQEIDRPALARRILEAYCQMVFVDGVFHADPHPGNILVHRDGMVTFIDFGAVGYLSPGMKAGVPMFWDGIIRRDPATITAGLGQMGLIARDDRFGDPEVAHRAIEYFQRKFLEQLTQADFTLKDIRVDMDAKIEALADLKNLDVSLRSLSQAFQLPKEWVIFDRMSILLLGLVTAIDPGMNPISIIGPYLQKFVLGPGKEEKAGVAGYVMTAVRSLAASAVSMPENANRFFDEVRAGQIRMQVRDIGPSAVLLYAAVRQAVFAFLSVAAGTLAYGLAERGLVGPSRLAAVGSAIVLVSMFVSMANGRELKRRLMRR